MINQKVTSQDSAIMGSLFAVALAAGALMAWAVMERLPHVEDEMAYLFQARTYARGALWAPEPPAPIGFFVPFVLNIDGKLISKYSPGWPMVLAVGERFEAGWLVNPTLGALTVVLIYMLGRDLFDRKIGTIAGLLALASPLYLIQSGTYMSHAAACLWAAALAWSLLRIEHARMAARPTLIWAIACGVTVGMLALTRALTAVAVVLPYAVVSGWLAAWGRVPLRQWIGVYGPAVGIALALILLHPIYQYVAAGDPFINLYTRVWPYDQVGFGDGYGLEGHTLLAGLGTAGIDLLLWTSDLFGWQYLSWAPVLAGLIVASEILRPDWRHWRYLLVAPFLMLVIVHLAYWVGAEVYGPRYYYEAHSGLAILAAVGIKKISDFRFQISDWKSGNWRIYRWDDRKGVIAYGLTLALIALNLATYLPTRLAEWHTLHGITRAPIDELERIRQSDRVLVLIRGQFWPDYAALMSLTTPWADGPVVAAHDYNPRQAARIVQALGDREIWYYDAHLSQFSRQPLPYDMEP